MTDWPQIIRTIMKDEKVTQRRLAVASGVGYSTIKRFFQRKAHLRAEALECVLTALGYSLTCEKTGSSSPLLKRKPSLPKRAPIRPKLIRAAGYDGGY